MEPESEQPEVTETPEPEPQKKPLSEKRLAALAKARERASAAAKERREKKEKPRRDYTDDPIVVVEQSESDSEDLEGPPGVLFVRRKRTKKPTPPPDLTPLYMQMFGLPPGMVTL